LQEKYGSEKVIALMGNHEKALLDWLEEYADVNRHIGSVEQYRSREWLASDADGDYETLHSFLKEEHFQEFLEKEAHLSEDSRNAEAVRLMFEDAGDLITWMRHFPYFYETERQILVHAGIAEWGGKDWLCVTSRELMVGKRTVSRGAFYKDVIAGHISTAKISGNRIYDGIWHDGQSHYYLDGTTWRSGKIPVLEYDSETGKYREIW
jgi:serine/threonine protein phosphatase 1